MEQSDDAQGIGDKAGNQRADRIPPPPLLDHEPGPEEVERGIGGNADIDGSAQFEQKKGWILKVRCPAQRGESTAVQVHVHPDMTAEVLGRCLFQAMLAHSPDPSDPIVGLFDERDGIFYSLQHILSSSDPTEPSYSTMAPFRGEAKADPTWSSGETVVLLGVVTAVAACYYGPLFLDYVMMVQKEVHYIVFDLPFREMYRYGPHLIGWEGMDLAEVCSRITYHGNRDFWVRNIEECEAIYAGKEEAFLRVTRPIAYLIFLVTGFFAIRHLITRYAESKRDKTDRVVLETYHAFQTLVRLGNRQMSKRN